MADPDLDQVALRRLLDADSPAAIHDATVAVAKEVFGADDAHLLRRHDGELAHLASTGDPQCDAQMVPVAEDILDQLDLIGRSHVFDDIRNVRSVAANAEVTTRSDAPRAMLLVPIDEVGLLVAVSTDVGAFDDGDRQWGEQLATFVEGRLTDEAEGADPADDTLARVLRVLDQEFADPLAVLRGSIHLAEAEGDPGQFERARRAADRIEHLLAGARRLGRTEEHGGRREVIELRGVVEEVWPELTDGDTSLEVRDSRPVVADRYALEQVIRNLLANAVEHGGEHVLVGTTEDGFFVEDDGPGIPSGLRGDAFAWGSSSNGDHKGIGLSIVAQICDAHGWDVAVTEGDLGGARVEITDQAD